MKKLTILIVLALLCHFFKVEAQIRYTTEALKVGDTIPDVILKNVINYNSPSIRLSDHKDKLIIVDFWGTTCVPCIQHLPIIYKLQKEFANQVFFLPVDIDTKYDPPAKIEKFFAQRKKAFDLPSVVMDTVMKNLFHPQYLGLYVWIKNEKVFQYTDAEAITSDNISKALSTDSLSLRQIDITVNDYEKPLFDDQRGKLPLIYYTRSMLFPYTPSLNGAGWQTDSTGKVYRVSFINIDPYSLLLAANPAFAHFNERVKNLTGHADLYPADFDTDSARKKNSFCYEAIFPAVSRVKAVRYIKEDIARYFPYLLDSALVTDSCWVLSLSKTKKLKVSNSLKTGSTNIYDKLGLANYFYNKRVSELRMELEHQLKMPVLDETGYKNNIWVDLPADLTKIELLQQSFAKQGFDLSKKVRPVQYLVIKELAD